MTKTLTEQWKDGELPQGEYYVITSWTDEIRMMSFYGDCFLDTDVPLDDENIKEVLAPVPSYDELERLQEQLKEANELLKSLTPLDRWQDDSNVNSYLKKWGVK